MSETLSRPRINVELALELSLIENGPLVVVVTAPPQSLHAPQKGLAVAVKDSEIKFFLFVIETRIHCVLRRPGWPPLRTIKVHYDIGRRR